MADLGVLGLLLSLGVAGMMPMSGKSMAMPTVVSECLREGVWPASDSLAW